VRRTECLQLRSANAIGVDRKTDPWSRRISRMWAVEL